MQIRPSSSSDLTIQASGIERCIATWNLLLPDEGAMKNSTAGEYVCVNV
jgi:hypothetical protein